MGFDLSTYFKRNAQYSFSSGPLQLPTIEPLDPFPSSTPPEHNPLKHKSPPTEPDSIPLHGLPRCDSLIPKASTPPTPQHFKISQTMDCGTPILEPSLKRKASSLEPEVPRLSEPLEPEEALLMLREFLQYESTAHPQAPAPTLEDSVPRTHVPKRLKAPEGSTTPVLLFHVPAPPKGPSPPLPPLPPPAPAAVPRSLDLRLQIPQPPSLTPNTHKRALKLASKHRRDQHKALASGKLATPGDIPASELSRACPYKLMRWYEVTEDGRKRVSEMVRKIREDDDDLRKSRGLRPLDWNVGERERLEGMTRC
ncbi:hypothetical protein BCR34DRAFT_593567 [Clohesyomyces aquaticus]|uniref:Uncharacterized protein n=1 Tax=Clohesyomyces aquaticus TaxID=1231657 RepID=A0A1Y1YGT3_9PLEO|nr:hypothetical protein BCR34DRAFT_593567 [Clohesyomyces aquaticus]